MPARVGAAGPATNSREYGDGLDLWGFLGRENRDWGLGIPMAEFGMQPATSSAESEPVARD